MMMGGTDEIILGPDEQSGIIMSVSRKKKENVSKMYTYVYMSIYTRLCVRIMKNRRERMTHADKRRDGSYLNKITFR